MRVVYARNFRIILCFCYVQLLGDRTDTGLYEPL